MKSGSGKSMLLGIDGDYNLGPSTVKIFHKSVP